MAKEIKKRLNRDFLSTDSNQRILEAYHRVIDQNTWLNEDATADAMKTLKAIIGALEKTKNDLKDKKSKSNFEKKGVYPMAKDMMKSYEKNKGFSRDQAQWIYRMSKAMFK